MEDNANAFVTLKLASAWLAMRLDLLGLLILTGCGALVRVRVLCVVMCYVLCLCVCVVCGKPCAWTCLAS